MERPSSSGSVHMDCLEDTLPIHHNHCPTLHITTYDTWPLKINLCLEIQGADTPEGLACIASFFFFSRRLPPLTCHMLLPASITPFLSDAENGRVLALSVADAFTSSSRVSLVDRVDGIVDFSSAHPEPSASWREIVPPNSGLVSLICSHTSDTLEVMYLK